MSGPTKLLFDTNAIISLLNGNPALHDLMPTAEWVGISVITSIEFLSFGGLSDSDRSAFSEFCSRAEVVALNGLDAQLLNLIVEIRKKFRLKLPDAIVAGTAIAHGASLVTVDQHFHRVVDLSLVSFD